MLRHSCEIERSIFKSRAKACFDEGYRIGSGDGYNKALRDMSEAIKEGKIKLE